MRPITLRQSDLLATFQENKVKVKLTYIALQCQNHP